MLGPRACVHPVCNLTGRDGAPECAASRFLLKVSHSDNYTTLNAILIPWHILDFHNAYHRRSCHPIRTINTVSQIKRYNRWLHETGRVLHQPDLAHYRDLLLDTLAPASVRVHLSSIRRSYKALIENPQHRAALVNYLQQ